MEWLDRVPTYPGRVKITKEDGTFEYVTIERADEPTVVGTPVNAANMNALEAKVDNAYSDDNKPTHSDLGFAPIDNQRTDIPNGSDLNSTEFQTIGSWRATTVAVATSLVNCPVQVAFTMDIVAGTGYHNAVSTNSGYIIQKIQTNEGEQWFRRIYAGSTGLNIADWTKVMTSKGGTFTGNVFAYSTNRASTCVRNITVYDSAQSAMQSTDKIIMVRK